MPIACWPSTTSSRRATLRQVGGLRTPRPPARTGLAGTNASLAFVQHFFEWNYGAAETSYRRALQADPNYGPARFWFAFLLASIGRSEDARTEIAAARAAEPFSSIITGGASYLDYFLGDHALGLQTAAAALEADPNYGPGHMFLGFHYGATGRLEQAVKCWRAAVERLDRLLLARLMLAAAHARAGDPAQARSLLLQLDNSAQGYVSPYFRAIAALALGEREAALGLLENALADRNSFLVLSGLEPLFVELHGEPRFLRVVEQVGVPVVTSRARHCRPECSCGPCGSSADRPAVLHPSRSA
jgi:tetratricopeptide (TPR) repeat protein